MRGLPSRLPIELPALAGWCPGAQESRVGGTWGQSEVRQAHRATPWATKARVGVELQLQAWGSGARRHLAPAPESSTDLRLQAQAQAEELDSSFTPRHHPLALVVCQGNSLHFRMW